MRSLVVAGTVVGLVFALASSELTAEEQLRGTESQEDDLVLVGRVVKVTDGDTIRVALSSGEIVVRLDGIDAPESQQKHGASSTQALGQLVGEQTVELAPILQDRYDRLVAVVFVNGKNVNADMVRSGNAWAYRRYLRDPLYCQLEHEARQSKRGLWSGHPAEWIAPWEFRQRRRLTDFADYSDETIEACVASLGE